MKLILASIFVFLFQIHSWADSIPVSAGALGCPTFSATVRLQISGELELLEKLLPLRPDEKKSFITRALRFQLLHLMGAMRSRWYSHDQQPSWSLSAYRTEPEIISESGGILGADLELKRYWPLERGENSETYFKKILESKILRKGDAVRKIEFKTELIASVCASKKLTEEELKQDFSSFQIPRDPYLTMWIQSPGAVSSRSLGQEKINFAPACFAHDYVHFGSPDQSWFFWSPKEKFETPDKKTVQCQIENSPFVYRPRIASFSFIPEFKTPDAKFFQELAKKQEPLKIALTFGVLADNSNQWAYRNMPDFQKLVLDRLSECRAKTVPICMKIWSRIIKNPDLKIPIEPGALQFLTFMKHLPTFFDIKSVNSEATSNGSGFYLTLDGVLKGGSRSAVLKVYFGSTGLWEKPSATEEYWARLLQNLKEQDIFLYLGHSGLGSNLDIATIATKAGLDPVNVNLKRDRSLWLGIYNCEGFSYYGSPYSLQFGSQDQRELLFITSTGTEAGAKFVLLHFEILKKALGGKNFEISSQFGKYVNSNEYLMVQQFRF